MARLAALSLIVLSSLAAADAAEPADRYAEEMQKFDRHDAENAYPEGGVVFVGSSSIRLWDLGRDFPDLKPLNRGFGGSQLSDVNRHLDRLVIRHRPRAVVLYAGDNDIAAGRTPRQVRDDFVVFVDAVRKELPETRVLYLAIKPSPARWKLADRMREANTSIEAATRSMKGVEFVDVWPAMLNDQGTPEETLFLDDRLHMNERGYAIWTDALRPRLGTTPEPQTTGPR